MGSDPELILALANFSSPTLDWKETLDALPGLAYALRPEGGLVHVNKHFYEYTGMPVGSASETRWRALIHPDDLEAMRATVAAGRASGEVFRYRSRIRSGSGEYRQYDATVAPFHDENGQILLWFGIATDVEDRMRATRSLAESERRLLHFLDAVPQIVWTADETGWLDWYNARWYEFTGQTPEEAKGWGWQDAHHPDDFGEVMRRWPACIASGELFEMEFRLRRRDGIYRWMLTRAQPQKDENGVVTRWYGSNTDIDDQKRSAQRSTRMAQLLQDALLPHSLPRSEGFYFDAVYEPAGIEARVGGDWYDAFRLADGRVVISVGDVTGHGVEAAAHAGRLRQTLAFAALEDPEPARILKRVNAFVLAQDLPIATASVAVFDPVALTLDFALAGHPPPVIAHADGRARIASPDGFPLGVTDEFETGTHAVALGDGALFAFYTDGITEQNHNVDVAERALCAAAHAIVLGPPVEHPAEILRDAALEGKESADDNAVIVLRTSSPHLAATTPTAPLSRIWRYHASHARAAHSTRRRIGDYLRTLGTDAAEAFDAELVVGEIIANTVAHGRGMVEIELDWSRKRPRVRIRDHGSVPMPAGFTGMTVAKSFPGDRFAENGRGLAIVHALASNVVIESVDGGGTLVACTLPIERRIAARPSN